MSESIKVICRVRPLNDAELASDSKFVVSFPGDGKSSIALGGKTFAFDHVFQPKAAQLEVYDVVAKPIVADVLNGYNGTIFAYGQTSSGKTFTMEGILGDPVFQGVIPRIIHDIFNHIYQMDENLEFRTLKYIWTKSAICWTVGRLCNLLTLLVSKTNLSVHEDKDRVPYVKGATERFVSSPEEVFDVIDEGKVNRHVAVTNMNEHSSRSHSVFMITVRQENMETQKKLHGKLYLVDLAGSEKVAKTGAEGTVLDEAKNINKSLSALGNVINALVEGSSHVPYRDSKLTRILQESLGGNARTTMVICCSPAAYNDSETKSTLMFGMRAKTIKNMVTVNEELTADEWRRRYEREKDRVRKLRIVVSRLEAELKRWRAGESVSQSEWFTENQYISVLDETKDVPTTLPAATLTGPPATGPASGLGVPTAATSVAGAATPTTLTGRPANVPTALVGPDRSSVTDEQMQMLYNQMDDKDDEINKQAQTIARLRQQLEEQDEIIRSIRKDRDTQLAEITAIQAEYQSSKDEVKEVLQALEELAMNYDQKAQEIDQKTKELEEAQESLSQQTRLMHNKDGELTQLRDSFSNQKKKYSEMMGNLLKDLTDVGECMSVQLTKPSFGTAERLDEEFTVMRLYLSKMKTEAKSLQSRVRQLEEERVQHVQLMRKSEDESKDLRTRLHALEVKLGTLTDKIDDSDARKRQLQETVDSLNAEVAKLRANEQLLSGTGEQNQQILAGQSSIRAKLDEEFKRQSEQYAIQVKELRDELDEKQNKLEELKDHVHNLKFQGDKSDEELVRLRKECEEKTIRLEAMEKAAEKREQAKQDLRGLEETVIKELQTLHNLRRLFVQDLNNRIKKSASRMNAVAPSNQLNTINSNSPAQTTAQTNDPNMAVDLLDEDETSHGGSLAQREKIVFLEFNLDKLTKVHKQLVHDNAELQCELPKLEKRLKVTVERVRSLEASLREAKEGAMRDRKRYQAEVERIKEVVRQRNMTARRGQPQIAKPIRAGHCPGGPHAPSSYSANLVPVRPGAMGAP
ncbi:kinesin family member 5 [Paragonimus westermani]|uniref:Kinesin heavy chain n=1 Tax=Paragonimus westermani TaxID=34504 RepID=A0A5J4NH12_9TREM|nr:kinesin family member 5 [Paragonimus westermani]